MTVGLTVGDTSGWEGKAVAAVEVGPFLESEEGEAIAGDELEGGDSSGAATDFSGPCSESEASADATA